VEFTKNWSLTWWDVSRLRPYVMFVLLDFVYLSAFLFLLHIIIILASLPPARTFTKEGFWVDAGRPDCPSDSCCNKKYMNDQSLLQKMSHDHSMYINVNRNATSEDRFSVILVALYPVEGQRRIAGSLLTAYNKSLGFHELLLLCLPYSIHLSTCNSLQCHLHTRTASD
jgi:hypothetical protein